VKITDVTCTMLRLPEVRPIADGTQDTLVVQVHTDAGITGVGEAHTSPWAIKAIIEAPLSHVMARGLREIVVGQDPRDVRAVWDRMYAFSSVFGRRGAVVHAMSAIDMALWDILGKATDQPVWRLLGGAYRHEVPVYASILALESPDASVARARELVAAGYRAIKFGWNGIGHDVASDVSTMARVRDAIGPDVDLMLDVGAPMPLASAIELARGLEPLRVRFLEEPLSPDDLDGYAALGAATSLAIATGEKETTRFGFRDLIERGRVDVVQPDVARAGGLTECRRIADLAEIHGTTVVPHCWSTDVLVAATLHLIASLHDCPYLEYCIVDNPIRTSVTQRHIVPSEGVVAIPDAPGLGIELDFDTLDRYRYEPA
jgi:L-alanine-DL-glutamate epimerase-like enolase superfamily enzyme